MMEPLLHLKIESELEQQAVHVLHPGETLRWACSVESPDASEIQALENSVLWYTEGKGEEDLAVHYFDRQSVNERATADLTTPRRLETQLPMTPLSYSGVIVKVRWCVRSRVFLKSGKELCKEVSFQLSANPRTPDAAVPLSEGGADSSHEQDHGDG